MIVLGALEKAQLEWFTNAGKPAASSYAYRVIWVTDLKEVQVSDGSNWMKIPVLQSTADVASTATINALASTTTQVRITGSTATTINGIAAGVAGQIIHILNVATANISVVPESGSASASDRISTMADVTYSIPPEDTLSLMYDATTARWRALQVKSNQKITSVSTNYTALLSDDLINVDCTSGAVTVTLPAAATSSGKVFSIRKVDQSTNLLTIDPNSTELIGGQSTWQLIGINQVLRIVCDGSGWIITSNSMRWPNSALEPGQNITAASYTVTAFDDHLRPEPTSNAITITLPAIGDALRGKQYTISRRGDNLSNAVTIQTTGGDTISLPNGTSPTSIKLMTRNETVVLEAGPTTGWVVTNRYVPSYWTSFTPTIGTGSGTMTNHTDTAYWRRVGQNIEIRFKIAFTGAAGTFGSPYVTLPTGLTFNTTILQNGANGYNILGTATLEDSGVANYLGVMSYRNSTTAEIGTYLVNATYATNQGVTQAIPFSWASADTMTGVFTAPITDWEG